MGHSMMFSRRCHRLTIAAVLAAVSIHTVSRAVAADWTGAYVGVQAGASRSDVDAQQLGDFDLSPAFPPVRGRVLGRSFGRCRGWPQRQCDGLGAEAYLLPPLSLRSRSCASTTAPITCPSVGESGRCCPSIEATLLCARASPCTSSEESVRRAHELSKTMRWRAHLL